MLRAREEYRAAGERFPEDYTRQDAAILNITRACEQSIDLASHLIRAEKLGIPTDSAESFGLLVAADIIPAQLAGKLKRIVGFLYTVVQQYQTVDLRVVEAVITAGFDDLLAFAELCRRR